MKQSNTIVLKQYIKTLSQNRLAKFAINVLVALIVSMFSTTYAAALPWDSGLRSLSTNITGVVAPVIGLLSIVAAAAMLIWGGEINGFIRSMIYTVLVVGIIVGAASILSMIQQGAGS